jgi:hypothetical protein
VKPYKELECETLQDISDGIYKFVTEKTDLLQTNAYGWNFLDHKDLFKSVPQLIDFFRSLKLLPNSASVVILTETQQLALHVDELPVVAKINFPVRNTTGWVNRWYSVSEEDFEKCTKQKNQFGKEIEVLSSIPASSFSLLAEIKDLNKPIVFNSRIPHEVARVNGDSPRIIASFTFVNEPLGLLE